MNEMKITTIARLMVLALAVVATPVRAEDDAPAAPAAPTEEPEKKEEGPTLDELSEKTLEAYREKAYRLDDKGIEKATFDIRVKIDHPMQQMEVTGAFRWVDGEGSIDWGNPMMAAQFGAMDKQLSAMFEERELVDRFGTAKLTAEKQEDGSVVITVTGENPEGLTRLTFGPDGLLASAKAKEKSEMGTFDVTTTYGHAEVGETGKIFPNQQTIVMDSPMGQMTRKVTNVMEPHGDLHVLASTTIEISQMGQVFGVKVTFENWKVDDEVDAPAETTPAPEEKPVGDEPTKDE